MAGRLACKRRPEDGSRSPFSSTLSILAMDVIGGLWIGSLALLSDATDFGRGIRHMGIDHTTTQLGGGVVPQCSIEHGD
ncbi:MAG: hypothetical protein JW986_08245 [Methanotrichaceae archaeon]|nr:hypothetical protein [Methanotrichaceae archaeon]